MIVNGRRAATRSTKSPPGPAARRRSITRVETAPIRSFRPVTVAEVNARETIRRSRACFGSSMLIIEPKYSTKSSGRSGIVVAPPRPEEKTLALRLAATTSACLTSAWYPGPRGAQGSSISVKNAGASSLRSRSNAAVRSACDRAQNSRLDRSKSMTPMRTDCVGRWKAVNGRTGKEISGCIVGAGRRGDR